MQPCLLPSVIVESNAPTDVCVHMSASGFGVESLIVPPRRDMTENSQPPRLSVIVTAFDRRDYLAEALQSVKAQTLPRDEFEVIVTSNFEDGEVSRIVSNEGYQFVKFAQGGAGAQLAQAIGLSRGEILVFLDDDDLWRPDKLARVKEAFDLNSRLDLHLHTIERIDARGAQIEGRTRADREALARMRDRSAQLIAGRMATSLSIDRVLLSASVSSSTLSVRRRTVEAVLPALSRILAAVDYFLLFTALGRGEEALFVNDPMTRWRRHSQNFTKLIVVGYREFLRHFSLQIGRLRLDNEIIRDASTATAGPGLQSYLRHKVGLIEQLSVILGGTTSRTQVARSLFRDIADLRQHPDTDHWILGLILAKIAYIFSADLSRAGLFLIVQGRRRGEP